MIGFAAARRRAIAKRGRTMVLARPYDDPAPDALTVTGFMAPFTPDKIAEPVKQGDAQIFLTNDEIGAAEWPTPGNGTQATVDGAVWTVQGASPVYDGPELIGWVLWVRGGEP